MSVSIDLRVLASKLEKNSDNLLIRASHKGPEVFEKVATTIAAASTLLEEVADDMDNHAEFSITEEQLNEIAALASAFDESGDPLLRKQASVLDELLLSIAAPKTAALSSRKVYDDEINRIREERSRLRREEVYVKPAQEHARMQNKKEQAKAVAQQVRRYAPLEAPLQTRYPPDRPGGQMTRITDHVYQDIVTGIIYDYKAGYKTQKGNEVPGCSVENQTRDFADIRNQGASLFETRDSIMNRGASDEFAHLKKYAMQDQVANAIQVCRDAAPELLDRALDCANQDGFSTSEVADILVDSIGKYKGASEKRIVEILKTAGDNFGGLVYHLTVSALAREKPVKKRSKLDLLSKLLKQSQVREFEFEGEPLDLELDTDEPEHSGLELAIEPEITPMPTGLPSFITQPKTRIEEFQKLVEPQPEVKNEPFEAKPVETKTKPSFLSQEPEAEREVQPKETASGLETPFSNLGLWGIAYSAATEELFDKKKSWGFMRLLNKENKDGTPRYTDKQKQVMMMDRINQIMKAEGFVGPYEKADIPEGQESKYKPSDFSFVTYKDVFEFNNKLSKKPIDEVKELDEIIEPSPEEIPSFNGRPTEKERIVKWPSYMRATGVNVTDEVADSIDSEIEETWKQAYAKYKYLFDEFEFGATKEMPEWGIIPIPVQDKLKTMFYLREKTPAILEKYPMMLAEYFASRDVARKDRQAAKSENPEEKAKLKQEASHLASLVDSEDDSLLRMYGSDLQNYKVSDEDLMSKIRSYVLSSGPAMEADKLLKEIRTAAYKHTVDKVLTENKLPSFFKEEMPSLADFSKKLQELGAKTSIVKQERKRTELKRNNELLGGKKTKGNKTDVKKKKSVLDIPTGEDGEELIPVWDMGYPYMEALVEAYKEYPPEMENPEGSKWPIDSNSSLRDDFMEERGFVPPSAKVIAGRASINSMISSIDGIWKSLGKDENGNWLGKTLAFPIDPTMDTGDLKTIFTDPDNYLKAFVAAKENNPFQRADVPKEFAQITVREPSGMPFLTDVTKAKLADLISKGEKEEVIVNIMSNPVSNGLGRAVPEESIKKAVAWMNASKKLQGNIWVLALKGKSAEDIMKVIANKYPGAQIKPGVIEFFVDRVRESMAREAQANERIDKRMQAQGFYPPNKELIGNKTTADILKQKGRKNPYQDLTGLKSMKDM